MRASVAVGIGASCLGRSPGAADTPGPASMGRTTAATHEATCDRAIMGHLRIRCGITASILLFVPSPSHGLISLVPWDSTASVADLETVAVNSPRILRPRRDWNTDIPGLSHLPFCGLGEDGDQVGVIPSGALELTLDRRFGGLQRGQIESQAAQKSQVLRPVVLAVAEPVLIHRHIQNPVQPVLNAPMRPHDRKKALRRERLAQQKIACLLACPGLGLARGRDLADGL